MQRSDQQQYSGKGASTLQQREGEDEHGDEKYDYNQPSSSNGARHRHTDNRSHGKDRRRSPPPPKLATFRGESTEDWTSYCVQFERITKTYSWGDDDQLNKLLEGLRGNSAQFYGRLPLKDRDNFAGLRNRLEVRYGMKDPPHTLRHHLQFIKQLVEEDLESFAERVQQLAYNAYPEAQDRTVSDACVDAFLRGCREKRAALSAMDHGPSSLNIAIRLVKSAVHNQRALFGDNNKVRQVSFNSDPPSEPGAVRTVKEGVAHSKEDGQMGQVLAAKPRLTKAVEGLQPATRDQSPRRSPSPSSN